MAVLLDVTEDPPADEIERIERVIDDVSFDDLRSFVVDELAWNRNNHYETVDSPAERYVAALEALQTESE